MYEVKGVIDNGGKAANVHWVMTSAASLMEAVSLAADNGMYDFHAAHLSKVMETFDNGGCKWYRATVKEERERQPEEGQPEGTTPRKRGGAITLTYDILVKENDVAGASSFIKRQMEQGYDFELSSVKETKIDDVI